jgi:predicted Zn-dependent protease
MLMNSSLFGIIIPSMHFKVSILVVGFGIALGLSTMHFNSLASELPDLGDISSTVLSPLQERQIAEQILQQVATSPEVEQDPEISDYITVLGSKLVESGPDPRQAFNFFVLQDSSINAFAMPGGVVGVHTGLILAANTESELAGVLGHEIGHVTQRHLARMLASKKYDMFKNIAGIALALLVARSNPQLASGAMATSSAIGIQNQLDFTREYEREADRIGMQILESGGFDVRGMPAFFATLQRQSRGADSNAPGFLRTHPLTTERIADVANRVSTASYKQVRESQEFLYVRAKLRAMNGDVQTAIHIFEDNIREKRFSDEWAEHYGLTVAYLRKKAYLQATQEMAWLKAHAPPHAMLDGLQAKLYVAQNDPTQAEAFYLEALKRFPDSRALAYGFIDHLIALKQFSRAIVVIKEKQRFYPDNAHFYHLLSKCYANQQKQLLSHQALGEAYVREYNIPMAIDQMEIAVKAKDGDFYESSIVEARLRLLRQKIADEPKK